MAAAPGLHTFDAAAEMAAAGDDPARREAALMNILNQANTVALEQRARMPHPRADHRGR